MVKRKKKEIKLTPKQKIFADELLLTKNKTKAAQKAYPEANYDTQRKIGSLNSTKENIRAYIEECAPEAFNTILEIMNKQKAPDHVRLSAAKDVLDRGGLKPTDKIEQTFDGKVEILWNVPPIKKEVLPTNE